MFPVHGINSTVFGSCLQVVAQVNNGKGEFMVSVKPKASLCDGMFHKISGKMSTHFMKDHHSTQTKIAFRPY